MGRTAMFCPSGKWWEGIMLPQATAIASPAVMQIKPIRAVTDLPQTIPAIRYHDNHLITELWLTTSSSVTAAKAVLKRQI
jgi:hypothetical protein